MSRSLPRSLSSLRAVSLRAGVAALAAVGLSGCVVSPYDTYGYGPEAGYGDAYAARDCVATYGGQYWQDDRWQSRNSSDDGYGYGYDCYDPVDYRDGFANIGFSGGWYSDWYYPGFGIYIFDRGGYRRPIYGHHLNYWGGRRAFWRHAVRAGAGVPHDRDGWRDGRRGRNRDGRDGAGMAPVTPVPDGAPPAVRPPRPAQGGWVPGGRRDRTDGVVPPPRREGPGRRAVVNPEGSSPPPPPARVRPTSEPRPPVRERVTPERPSRPEPPHRSERHRDSQPD